MKKLLTKSYCEGEVKKRSGSTRFGHCTKKPTQVVASTRPSATHSFHFCDSCAKRYLAGKVA